MESALTVRKTKRPLRESLIAAAICIDCQLRDTDGGTQRCGRCRAAHARKQRERQLKQSTSPKALLTKTRIRSYTTLMERGLIKPK